MMTSTVISGLTAVRRQNGPTMLLFVYKTVQDNALLVRHLPNNTLTQTTERDLDANHTKAPTKYTLNRSTSVS